MRPGLDSSDGTAGTIVFVIVWAERPHRHASPAARQSFQIRLRASSKLMRPTQTARARQASTASLSPASSQGCNSRFRGSDGASLSASGIR